MTIFAPIVEKTQLSLDIPDEPTIYSTAVTQVTQLSLEGPTPEETGKPPQDATAKPDDSSPAIDTGSARTTYITVAPSPHLEHSGTYIVLPDTDTADASRAPKIPHTMVTRTDLDGQTETTDQAATPDQGDDGNSETARPGATSKPTEEVTGIAIVVPVETGKPGGGSNSGSQDQQSNDDQSGSGPAGSPTGSPTGDSEGSASRTLLFGTTPIVAGGSPVTVDGTTFSVASTGSAMVVNGATISFTTDEDGKVVPLGTSTGGSSGGPTDTAAAQILGGLSVATEETTATGENSQETQSTRSPTSTADNNGSQQTSAGNGESENGTDESEATSTGNSPATQSDSAGVSNSLAWPFTAAMGAIGILVAAL